jgi:hypothetical protein
MVSNHKSVCLGPRTAIVWYAHQYYSVLTLHGSGNAIAKEFRLRFELADDAYAVCRGDVQEGGNGWVV